MLFRKWVIIQCFFSLMGTLFLIFSYAQSQENTEELEEVGKDKVAINEEVWDQFQYQYFYHEGELFKDVALTAEFPQLGQKHIYATLVNDDVLLPIGDFFEIIEVKAEHGMETDTLEGHFLEEDHSYLIVPAENLIKLNGQRYETEPGELIRTREDVLVHQDVAEEVFGIKQDFNPQRMSIFFEFEKEMPYQKRLKLEEQRKNKHDLKNELPEADTTVGRSRPIFDFGVFDWNISSSFSPTINRDRHFTLSLDPGGKLGGGAFRGRLRFDSRRLFEFNNQRFVWEYINDESEYFRQTFVGKGFNSISDVRGNIWGVSTTNQSFQPREYHSTYLISDHIEPDWTVELYKNDLLIDYVKTDETGFYEFEVPLSYGRNDIELRFYGPHGEERYRNVDVNIPTRFAPEGELEYEATGGVIRRQQAVQGQHNAASPFVRVRADYGLSRYVSLGAGYEYLSSFNHEKHHLKFAEVNAVITSRLTLNTRYIHNYQTTIEADYRSSLGFNLRGRIERTTNKAQNLFNASSPITRYGSYQQSFNILSSSHSIGINHEQRVYSDFQNNRTHINHSLGLGFLSFRNSFVLRYEDGISLNTNMNNNTDFSFRLPNRWRASVGLGYNLFQGSVNSISLGARKRFDESTFNFEIQRNVGPHSGYRVSVGYGYSLDFANTSFSAALSGGDVRFSQRASGGVFADTRERGVHFDERSIGESAGIKIIPFLDVDQTGYKSKENPRVLHVDVDGRGQIHYDEQDSLIRITNLSPYEDYHYEFNLTVDADISWRIGHETMNIRTDKNNFKKIYLPIEVKGEVSGVVTRQKDGEVFGQPRVRLIFENLTTGEVFEDIYSRTGGKYRNFELTPGKYRVKPSKEQMKEVDLVSQPLKQHLKLEKGQYGNFQQGVDFHLLHKDSLGNQEIGEFNNYWVPKNRSYDGLNFNQISNQKPRVFDGYDHLIDAEAMISGEDGKPVLYINEFGRIYNANETTLSETLTWDVEVEEDKACLFFPVPGNENHYYFAHQNNKSEDFYYTKLKADKSEAEVLEKSRILTEDFQPATAEAIKSQANNSIFLLAAESGADRVKAFQFPDGKGPWRDVASELPPGFKLPSEETEISVAPNGSKIAFQAHKVESDKQKSYLLVGDFEERTGKIKNFKEKSLEEKKVQNITFSPKGRKLYTFIEDNNGTQLQQLNLAGSEKDDSNLILFENSFGQEAFPLKTGPDGKIYFARETVLNENELGIIHRPEKQGDDSRLSFYPDISWSYPAKVPSGIQKTGSIVLSHYTTESGNEVQLVNLSHEPDDTEVAILKNGEEVKKPELTDTFRLSDSGHYRVKATLIYGRSKHIIERSFEIE